MNTPNPGLRHQTGTRTILRVLGGVLAAGGAIAFVWGLVHVFGNDSYDGPRGIEIAAFMGGLLVTGVGLQLLYLGFLGSGARYAAGETMPVVKDSASYLSDGRGIMGVGATGPFCRACGARNDDEARFCDGCGKALA